MAGTEGTKLFFPTFAFAPHLTVRPHGLSWATSVARSQFYNVTLKVGLPRYL